MTHNERVLALLSDGRPHSHHELYGLHVIAHSRVSDLRKQGHTIEQWREGDDYLYRLLGGGDADAHGGVPSSEQPAPPVHAPAAQLSGDTSEEGVSRVHSGNGNFGPASPEHSASAEAFVAPAVVDLSGGPVGLDGTDGAEADPNQLAFEVAA